MTESVSRIVEGLRDAGFNINPVRASALWQVDGRGPMSTAQLIDLASKLQISQSRTH
ncbi:hypothetical protein ABENE_06890 [Asticcacaulis benevestitus DSM 16100 = ATCC BAA-896]|uniref:Uncharacterized protein n=1 Tax=Asticcacaulis benevestitus DSM 16100 = ATCC BAA-896 TaxID=1121022 RepID=V4PFR4_9CAUL|nr:hypothetical protein ABENE_06890 [Asticcacaulis benevestitus DSM 16100 = ATCC BAA-896]